MSFRNKPIRYTYINNVRVLAWTEAHQRYDYIGTFNYGQLTRRSWSSKLYLRIGSIRSYVQEVPGTDKEDVLLEAINDFASGQGPRFRFIVERRRFTKLVRRIAKIDALLSIGA